MEKFIQKIDQIKEYLTVRKFDPGEIFQPEGMVLKFCPSGECLALKDKKLRIEIQRNLNEIYQDKFLSENYSSQNIQNVILEDIFAILRGSQTDYVSFRNLFGKNPEECLIVRSIEGMVICSVKEMGGFLFFYSEQELVQKIKLMLNNDSATPQISVLFPHAKYPCIGATVYAIDHKRAREKALEAFRRFENITQFMVGQRWDDFYIRVIAPNILTSEEDICISKQSLSGNLAWVGPLGGKAYSIDDPFFKNIENGKIWGLLGKANPSNWEKKLIRSINWIGRGLRNPDINMAFLQMLFSLESLLVVNQEGFLSESITAKMADSVAYILSNDLTKRMEIAKQMKEFYGARSKVVHSGSENISLSELNKLFYICKGVIISIFRIKELEGIRNEEDLLGWFNTKKYS